MNEGPRSSRAVTVHRMRPREPWVIATFASVLLPMVGAAVAVGLHPWFVFAVFGLGWFALPFFLLPMWMWRRATRIEGNPAPQNARASKLGVFVDGGPSIPREMITAAFVAPSHPNGAYVRVHRRVGFPVELWTPDVAGAHALIAGLGLDESRAVGIVRGASPIARPAARLGLGALIVALAIAVVAYAPLLSFAIAPIALAYAVLGVVPRRFIVGKDGILIRWLGRRTFIPIDDIVGVEQRPGMVRLHLTKGWQDLVVSPRIGDRAVSIGMQVSLLAERIRAAMRRAGKLDVDTAALDRGDRDLESWIASLRDLARGTGYRAAVQREDLVFLVEDARTKPAIRVAAALALGTSDDHERARLRVAADSSSLPELSEALDAVLAGDDERLTTTLRRGIV